MVHIHSSDGNVDISNHLGVVNIQVNEGGTTTIVESQSIGFSKVDDKYTFGYSDGIYAQVKDTCHLILFHPNESQINKIQNIVGKSENICVIDK